MVTQQPINLDELIALAQDRSAEARRRLVRIMGDLFFNRGSVLSPHERRLMMDILHQLIRDVEISVRRALAERLATEPDVPNELVRVLANDAIEVAFPILIHSTALHDVDLIEVIHSRTAEHQIAIASRIAVSESVSDALVNTGVESVIVTLLKNDGAAISDDTLAHLVEASRARESYQAPLVGRGDLPAHLAERLYGWVGEALKAEITSRFDIDPAVLNRALMDANAKLTAAAGEGGENRVIRAKVAQGLRTARALTPRFMIRSLQQGEILLFEQMFMEVTGLAPRLVKRLLFESGGEAMAAVCKASGFSKADFADIFLRTRSARPGEARIDPDEMPRAMTFFDRIDVDTAAGLLDKLRRDPEFLFALAAAEAQDSGAFVAA